VTLSENLAIEIDSVILHHPMERQHAFEKGKG